jgi:hypothetical protein
VCCESIGPNVDTSSIGRKRYFRTPLILLLGAAGHGDGPHDAAALDDGQCSCAGHDAAVARHDQALKTFCPATPASSFVGCWKLAAV